MKPLLLVTGASGFLGASFVARHRERYRIVAGTRGPAPAPGLAHVELDLADPAAIERAWREARPDAVLHLGARPSMGACRADPEGARRINVDATADLARRAAADGVRFVFTSTDLVFDGTAAPYAEDDPPAPLSEYGRMKAAAEARVLEASAGGAGDHLVCRISLVYGPMPGGGIRQLEWMLEAARAGRDVALFADEYRTPIDSITLVDALAAVVDPAAGRRPSGVLHLGGPERWSRLQLGRFLLEAEGHDPDLARAARGAEAPDADERPADVSLDTSRARGLGFDIPGPEEGWRRAVDDA